MAPRTLSIDGKSCNYERWNGLFLFVFDYGKNHWYDNLPNTVVVEGKTEVVTYEHIHSFVNYVLYWPVPIDYNRLEVCRKTRVKLLL